MGDFKIGPYASEFDASFYKGGTPYDEVFGQGADRGARFVTEPVPANPKVTSVEEDYVFVTKRSIGYSAIGDDGTRTIGPWRLSDGTYITDHLGIATKLTLPPN